MNANGAHLEAVSAVRMALSESLQALRHFHQQCMTVDRSTNTGLNLALYFGALEMLKSAGSATLMQTRTAFRALWSSSNVSAKTRARQMEEQSTGVGPILKGHYVQIV